MNAGEKNELLFKIFLCELKRKKNKDTIFGEINSIGFGEKQYLDLDEEVNFATLVDEADIKELAKKLCIEKSSPLNKADIYVNNISYSVKYMNAAPPSLINHTSRKGFLRIAEQLKIDISKLDNLIKIYWDLRMQKKITEDVSNLNSLSPFKENKEIVRPYLEYFCFTGTGKSDSKHKAKKLIKFNIYNEPSSWKIYSKKEAIDEIWDGLYFCMRDIGKGGVKDFTNHPDKAILAPWTKFSSGKYRGALSVRYKAK